MLRRSALHRAPSAGELNDGFAGDSTDVPRPFYPSDPERTEREILLEVDEFTTNYGLDDIRDLLRKGALILDNPKNLARVTDLKEQEMGALVNEKIRSSRYFPLERSWMDLASYIATVAFGWKIYGIIATDFMNNVIPTPTSDIDITTLKPFVLLAGCLLLGLWGAEPLNQLCGRRGTILLSCLLFMVAALGTNLSESWQLHMASGLLAGFALGVELCTIPVYFAETSVAINRGAIMSRMQFLTGVGIVLATYSHSLLLGVVVESGINIAFTMIPASIFLVYFWISPESPHYFVAQEDMQSGYQSLRRIRKTEIQAARDLYQIHLSEGIVHSSPRLFDLIRVPAIRRATVSSVTVAVAEIFISSAGPPFPKPQSFRDLASLFGPAWLILIGLFELIMMIIVLQGIILIDSVGRRRMFLFSTLSMLVLSFFLISLPSNILGVVLLTLAHLTFSCIFSLGKHIPVTYAAEVFPPRHRILGMAATMTVFNVAYILALFKIPSSMAHKAYSVDVYFSE
ncbi:hypothetical protein BDV26DRAFT_264571 [Aspergillus bertholletiae]|uniref:Major facilitator superfamily (MFS) profile domain-containing protein n=1 Tax=Aspergillus bertholletiae TaxID=1226010 RepID=A0A5N7B4U7_9EURO|nr:hypothetical protein BDV26DRAFT_264571 [Aspergillus bertholletiae]